MRGLFRVCQKQTREPKLPLLRLARSLAPWHCQIRLLIWSEPKSLIKALCASGKSTFVGIFWFADLWMMSSFGSAQVKSRSNEER